MASPALRRDAAEAYRKLDRDGSGHLDALDLKPLLAQLAKVQALALTDALCAAFLPCSTPTATGPCPSKSTPRW